MVGHEQAKRTRQFGLIGRRPIRDLRKGIRKHMQIAIHGKQIDIGDSLRAHIEDSVTRISEKYFGNPIDASVTVSRESAMIRADISVHVGRGIQVQSHGTANDAYAAYDLAGDKIEKRLRRHKRRLRDRHQKASHDLVEDVRQVVLASEAENADTAASEDGADWQPVIVAEMTTSVDNLSVEEAVMRMDLSDLPAVMFRNSAHGELNMIYRRSDGNIGWIDPKGMEQD